jgi:hypothetical protein
LPPPVAIGARRLTRKLEHVPNVSEGFFKETGVGELSRVRRSILPARGDGWNEIARRELPDVAEADAVARLQSWNLHVYMRATMRTGGPGNPILPSDVIFVEPPLAIA